MKKGLKQKVDNNTDLSSAAITSMSDLPGGRRRPETTGRAINPVQKKSLQQNGQLTYCNNILKEMLSKKHAAYAWPCYMPVDAKALKLHDYHDIIKYPMDLGTVQV